MLKKGMPNLKELNLCNELSYLVNNWIDEQNPALIKRFGKKHKLNIIINHSNSISSSSYTSSLSYWQKNVQTIV